MAKTSPSTARSNWRLNTQAEIQQAFADYRRTQFGGWTWGAADPVHPRSKGRFAQHTDGRVEEH
jgi:hypothetical protein